MSDMFVVTFSQFLVAYKKLHTDNIREHYDTGSLYLSVTPKFYTKP